MKGSMNEEIRLRKSKVGIVSPIHHWINSDLNEWFVELVDDKGLKNEMEKQIQLNRPFSADIIERAWKNVNRTILEE